MGGFPNFFSDRKVYIITLISHVANSWQSRLGKQAKSESTMAFQSEDTGYLQHK